MADSGCSPICRTPHQKGEEMSRLKSKKGQGLVEYVLVLVLMALLSVGTLKLLGKKTHNAFKQAADSVQDEADYAAKKGQSEKGI
jgi:Flp pilus assembly pilin Flp